MIVGAAPIAVRRLMRHGLEIADRIVIIALGVIEDIDHRVGSDCLLEIHPPPKGQADPPPADLCDVGFSRSAKLA